MARFDWYQGTVRAEVADLRACLRAGVLGGQWEPAKRAPHGYAFADRLVDADGLVAQVWWGGMHAHPHVVASSEPAQMVAELLRSEMPDHSVSRADACQDYADPGAYDRLQALAVQVARDKRVKVGTQGDHLVTLKGRTCYLGATSSHTRLRLYDKAEELRQQYAKDPVKLATVPEELARLECQVRPQTPEAKRAAALVDPITLMGSAAWMRELMRLVSGLELHPFDAGKAWRQSDDDRAYAALLAQYGGLLARVKAELGSWDCVGLQIGADLAERSKAKRTSR
jgi:hypothetical protein